MHIVSNQRETLHETSSWHLLNTLAYVFATWEFSLNSPPTAFCTKKAPGEVLLIATPRPVWFRRSFGIYQPLFSFDDYKKLEAACLIDTQQKLQINKSRGRQRS